MPRGSSHHIIILFQIVGVWVGHQRGHPPDCMRLLLLIQPKPCHTADGPLILLDRRLSYLIITIWLGKQITQFLAESVVIVRIILRLWIWVKYTARIFIDLWRRLVDISRLLFIWLFETRILCILLNHLIIIKILYWFYFYY